MFLEDTSLGYPLPHPENPAKTVDVPRLRLALQMIDAHVVALHASRDALASDKADKTQVAIDIATAVSQAISNLLDGAPEAYDTLVEIASKLTDNDDVVAGILSTLATKAVATDVVAALALKADDAAMTDALELKADAEEVVEALADKASHAEVATAVRNAAVPIGTIVAAVSSPGPDWLPCDGAAYLKTSYPDLADHVGDIVNRIHQSPATTIGIVGGHGIAKIKRLEGQWFAVASGYLHRSTNRTVWTQAYNAGGNYSFSDVAYGNGRYLLVSSVESSWTMASDSPTSGWAQIPHLPKTTAVEFEFGLFIAVCTQGGIATNSGVGAWTTRTSGVTSNLRALITRPGRAIAGGEDGTILFSDDSVTWRKATVPSLHHVLSFLDDGDQILAGCSGGQVWRSLDGGETWTAAGYLGSSVEIGSLVKHYDIYFAFARNQGGSRFSRDLVNWTVLNATFPMTPSCVAADGVITLANNATVNNLSLYSYDRATEFVVPNVSDSLGASPSEALNRSRWIRALAA